MFCVVAALIYLNAAAAATPVQAATRIVRCMTVAGATNVSSRPDGEGMAFFKGRFVSWAFVVSEGQVVSTGWATNLAGKNRRAALSCLKRYRPAP